MRLAGNFFFSFFLKIQSISGMTAQKQTTVAPSLFAKSDSEGGVGGRRSCEQALRPRRGCAAKTSQKKERKISKDYVNI